MAGCPQGNGKTYSQITLARDDLAKREFPVLPDGRREGLNLPIIVRMADS